MKILPKLLLLAGVIAFVVAVILAFADTCFIATPNGWLDLSLLLVVFSIAVKFVLVSEKKD